MRYSNESKGIIFVKSHGFESFPKNNGKTLSSKHSQKFLDRAKQSTTDRLKTASQNNFQKTAGATKDLTGHKIADKISNTSQSASKTNTTQQT